MNTPILHNTQLPSRYAAERIMIESGFRNKLESYRGYKV